MTYLELLNSAINFVTGHAPTVDLARARSMKGSIVTVCEFCGEELVRKERVEEGELTMLSAHFNPSRCVRRLHRELTTLRRQLEKLDARIHSDAVQARYQSQR